MYVPLLYEIFVCNKPCVSDTKSDSNAVPIFFIFHNMCVEERFHNVSFLGACSQIVKTTVSMSVPRSTHPHGTTTRLALDRFSYLSIFRKNVEKFRLAKF